MTMIKNLHLIKYAAAFTLLVSFFLPMSSCSYTVPLDLGMEDGTPGSGQAKTETRTVINYAREYIDLREPGSWLNLLGFLWPILIIALQFRYRGRGAVLVLPSMAALLSIYSMVVIYMWADIGKPLIGAYVGWCAAAGLLMIYLMELVRAIRGEGSFG